MVFTNTEIQRRFKERMYAKGYKQKMFWVRPEKKTEAKMNFETFITKMEKLTAGWSNAQLSRLFSLLVRITEGKEGSKSI